jgi:hypothetical protein
MQISIRRGVFRRAFISKIAILAVGVSLGSVSSVRAQQPHIVKFDAPNSGVSGGQGTTSTGINIFGTITGNVTGNDFGTHGFVRHFNGKSFNFDVKGADPINGCTCPANINDFGSITGFTSDTNEVEHGFVRLADGRTTVFDVAQAGTASGQGTQPAWINNFGVVAGAYFDSDGTEHGFVRTPDGKVKTIDLAGAVATGAFAVNDFGVISGIYLDENFVTHGFLRNPDGKTITFDPPAAIGGAGTAAAQITDTGLVGGSYFDATTNVEYGYVRSPEGHFKTFAAPSAGTPQFDGTVFYAANAVGVVVGFGADNNNDAHAFIRKPDNRVISLDIAGQLENAGGDFGSAIWTVNLEGVGAGRWRDSNFATHGFITLP